ncbi:MAG: hypothetical protein HY718_09655, partial [Planctomycetes bacterium]|nr:hypothetical protein [Planctomycetota bacterium]
TTVASPPLQGDTHWERMEMVDVAVPDGARLVVLDCHMSGGKPNGSRFGRDWRDTAWFDDLYLHREGE